MDGTIGDVEALKNQILSQAQEQATRTLDRARRVSERDMVYAREEAEEIRSGHKAEVSPLVEAEKRKYIASAEMEARRKLLERKEQLVSRIFTEAEDRLEELRGTDTYVDIVSGLIEEGVASIGGDAIVEYGKKDRDVFTPEAMSLMEDRVAKFLGKTLQVQFRHVGDNVSAGVVIRSKDGRIVVDNSFSGRLNRLRGELRGEVSEMLLQEIETAE